MAALQLHLLPPAARQAPRSDGELGDFALTAFIFALGALPVACDLAGLGRWSGGSLGLGTAGALLSGRELLAGLLRSARARRAPRTDDRLRPRGRRPAPARA